MIQTDVRLLNFMPHYGDPIQEATGLPAPLFFTILIAVTFIAAVILILIFYKPKQTPPFDEAQEKRIRDIIAEEKAKEHN